MKILDCNSNQLISLGVSDYSNLTELYCHNNLLTNIFLPKETEKLKVLALLNNNFKETTRIGVDKDLSFLKNYTNLEKLYLGNFTDHEDDFLKHYDKSKEESIYNRFAGTLEHLKELNKLKVLDISNTDISVVSGFISSIVPGSSGKLSLPENLEEIYCSSQERPGSKVKTIEDKLKKEDSGFYFPNSRYIKKRPAQEWLDENYPENETCQNGYDKENKDKERKDIKKIDIKEWGLTGGLDLSSFVNLEELDCSNNQLESLNLKGNAKLTKINCSANNLTEIDIKENKNLKEIYCQNNKLKSIDLTYHYYLTSLNVNDNELTDTNFLDALYYKGYLEKLKLGGNLYEKTSKRKQQSRKGSIVKHEVLDFLKPFTGLTELDISNCSFEGSLKPLENMSKLEILNISGTSIDGGLEYLPDSCQKLVCICDLENPKESDKIAQAFKKYHVDYQNNGYYDLAKWKSDIKNLLEEKRSNDIQKEIKKFFGEWRKEGILDKLKSPEELEEQGKRLYYTKWVGRGVSVASGILSLTSYPQIGGGIAVIYPFAEGIITESYQDDYESNEKKWDEFMKSMKRFWNHYRELVDILGPIEFCGEKSVIADKELKPLWEKINKISEKDNPKNEFAWDLIKNWDTVSGISRKKQWNRIAEYMMEISINGKSIKIDKEEDIQWSTTNNKGKETTNEYKAQQLQEVKVHNNYGSIKK